jgi:pyridoxal/pyridoxine/pyridoxamine kinase
VGRSGGGWEVRQKHPLVARDFSLDANMAQQGKENMIKKSKHMAAHMRLCEPNMRGHGDVACHLVVTGSGQLSGLR